MLSWLRQYHRALLAGDISAGTIVVLMMVPQGMAYALLTGLPPVAGLYAGLLPACAYALFGSSMVQSVGPAAITSLMAASSLAALAPAGSALYAAMAAQMALIVGVLLFLFGMLRLGFLVQFLSRPVLSGFTSGIALLITVNQLKPLLGGSLEHIHAVTAALGLSSLALLLLARRYLMRLLQACGLSTNAADILSKLMPVVVLTLAAMSVVMLDLEHAGVAVVGAVPAGLPDLGLTLSLGQLRELFVPSLLIGFMVFLSGQAAAGALAQKRGERLDADRELKGLGAANLASALSGSFVVTGSLSRSAVNHTAGANTPLASLITAVLMAVMIFTSTAWMAPLPLAALAATIIVAVLAMLDFATPREAWRYDRGDALAWAVTLGGVLLLGVEEGVVIGLLLSLGTLIARASRPHIAVLGRIPGSEHFRNITRHSAETCPELLMLRIDSAIFFGNAEHVSDGILALLQTETSELVLVLSAVNQIDTTGLYSLLELNRTLSARGIRLHLAEVKGPLMDRLQHSQLLLQNLSGGVFLSAASAFNALVKPVGEQPTR